MKLDTKLKKKIEKKIEKNNLFSKQKKLKKNWGIFFWENGKK